MRRIALIVISALIAAATLIAAANIVVWKLAPEWMAIVPADQAMEFATLCSRAAPRNIQGVWTPSIDDIREVERQLPAALSAELTKAGNFAPTNNPADYSRQYAGLVLASGRIVYVNGWFSHSPAADNSVFTLWGARPVHTCDGGEHAFGVEFDVTTRKLANFQFNTSIEPRP